VPNVEPSRRPLLCSDFKLLISEWMESRPCYGLPRHAKRIHLHHYPQRSDNCTRTFDAARSPRAYVLIVLCSKWTHVIIRAD